MPKLSHDLDLARRYRELDWVSEYQRLWAIFNHWLISQTGRRVDRDALQVFKREARLHSWVSNYVAQTAYPRHTAVTDGYAGSYPQFAANNAVSLFFRAAQASPTLANRISWYWRYGTDQRVRPIAAVAISEEQFRALYDVHAQVLFEALSFNLTLHETLPHLGIGASGCCFYRSTPPAGSPPIGAAPARLLDLIRGKAQLSDVASLAQVNAPSTLGEDLVESLYNLRNVAVHGSLDFLDPFDNAAARAGYDVLDLLVQDIRDRW
jgi:hypothetical protein